MMELCHKQQQLSFEAATHLKRDSVDSVFRSDDETARRIARDGTTARAMHKSVFFLASASSASSLQTSLLAGQAAFRKVFTTPSLDAEQRLRVLQANLSAAAVRLCPTTSDQDRHAIATLTEGYSATDLTAVATRLVASVYRKALREAELKTGADTGSERLVTVPDVVRVIEEYSPVAASSHHGSTNVRCCGV